MTDRPDEFHEIHNQDTRWWIPWMAKSEARRQIRALWAFQVAQTQAATVALERMETRMSDMENQAYARAAEVVGLLKAEFASLRRQVDAAVADKDAAVQAGIESALAEDSAADAERVEGLIGELESVLPGQTPSEVPEPEPGQPAELPDEQQG